MIIDTWNIDDLLLYRREHHGRLGTLWHRALPGVISYDSDVIHERYTVSNHRYLEVVFPHKGPAIWYVFGYYHALIGYCKQSLSLSDRKMNFRRYRCRNMNKPATILNIYKIFVTIITTNCLNSIWPFYIPMEFSPWIVEVIDGYIIFSSLPHRVIGPEMN